MDLFSFDEAARVLLDGGRVSRHCWHVTSYVGRGRLTDGTPHLVLRTLAGIYAYAPHSRDRLARDWMVVPKELWHA